MTSLQLQTIEEIFHAALECDVSKVGVFLDKACEGEPILRAEVETLLVSHQRIGSFIETPAVVLAMKLQDPQPDLRVGLRIGHYELGQRIGTGGMGDVYLATDIIAGRKAALKLLPTRFTGEAERVHRFEQEARAVVALNHPNILTVYEIGEHDSTYYIASELIDGETLRQHLARGPLELDLALEVAIQVASALQAAHAAGIVHRDIKPENVMLRPDGYVKVLDFGVAKLAQQEVPVTISREESISLVETNLGAILGTARYMSPEQVLGAPAGKGADIWSLGVVLYEMLTGRAPFAGKTAKEVMHAILTTEPPPLTGHVAKIPDELQRSIERAFRKKSEERYQSVDEFIDALKAVRRRLELSVESVSPWLHRRRLAAVLVVGLLLLVLVLAFFWQRNPPPSSIPEKSIAVLPFQNLSDNKANSDFAAGIQDDVLTSLAQIHDLKVISRTSAMAYQEANHRNVRRIGRELGVANVLEGSVRREGNRVLVNVQLIDARHDRHLWAERYERTVADSIGLQGELATQIAAALKTTLAPEEKARLGATPTANSEAYVLYLTALGKKETDWSAAEQLCVQATMIDPRFALAYAQASILNSWFANHLPARNDKARAQAEEAVRLSPNLGEAHVALGLSLYVGEKKYEAALKEFEIAAATSPNNASIYQYIGGIYRRQGRWRDATASFDRAVSLDPRNAQIIKLAANHRLYLRDWVNAAAGYKQALEVEPDSVFARVALAYLEVCRNGNPAAARKSLQNIPPSQTALTRWSLAMLERDYASAEKALSDFNSDDLAMGYPTKTFYQGRTALARGDLESAERYFASARPTFEEGVREDPNDAWRHAQLGLLYAYMQRKEEAIRESRRAVELDPESQNAYHGALEAANLALVYALLGEQEKAITLVERLLLTPGPIEFPDCAPSITLSDLRLRWEWDSLRSNPRFQKILSGPEPQTNLTNITQATSLPPLTNHQRSAVR